MSGDGDTILFSHVTDRDSDGSVDDVVSGVKYRQGGTACTTAESSENWGCVTGGFWGMGLRTGQVPGFTF